jgi:threonyl-tRNA synthetase
MAAEAQINITLPDGSVRQYPAGTTALQIAQSISPRLAKDALAAKTGDAWLDLRTPIVGDAPVRILTSRDAEGVEVIRHSAEHLMADAVKQLWPHVRIDVGRTSHDEKFQYDFDIDRPFSVEDLEKIAQRMQAIIAADVPFVREEVSREEAKRLFTSMGETLKVSRIDDIPQGQPISLYKHATFTDLCRGPHVQRSGQIKAFKLLEVSGAYFRGDENNPMLQRIYGTAFASREAMAAWEKLREEAERRDHRRLGKELDLFSIEDEVGGGLVLWHPNGAMVKMLMEDYWKAQHLRRGYVFVSTPHIGRARLWETSGHLGFFKENMFAPMEIEDDPYYAKPMNCPFHIVIYKSRRHSYRELPLRMAELGTVYRYERSGVLHGLMRVRGFTQDDAHIFCTPDQIETEIAKVTEFAIELLKTFGFSEFKAYLATKPKDSVGPEESWAQAEASLRSSCERIGLEYEVDRGGGAFYGPKIDIKIKDAIGRYWQCSTVQFDFNLPERFDLSYVGEDNRPHRPYMVHRALYGSVERFFGVLLEHHAGAFPLWLAPIQARVLPVTDRVATFASKVAEDLTALGLRTEVDMSNEKLGHKIRQGTLDKIPFLLIVGDKEAEAGGVSPRRRGGEDLKLMKLEEFATLAKREVAAELGTS